MSHRETIDAANDADLKERFMNAYNKKFGNIKKVFSKDNKEHAEKYNEILEKCCMMFDDLGTDKASREFAAEMLMEVARDLSAAKPIEYLDEAAKDDPVAKVAEADEDIESIDVALREIEKKLVDENQKMNSIIPGPSTKNQIETIKKKLKDLYNERERLQKQLKRTKAYLKK